MQTSRKLIESLIAEDDRRAAETYRFMEEQKIKKGIAPEKWEELRVALIAECEKVSRNSSRQISVEESDSDHLDIRNMESGVVLSMTYNPDVPCIQYTLPTGRSGHFGFRVARDGMSVQIMDGTAPKFVHEIVALTLIRILK